MSPRMFEIFYWKTPWEKKRWTTI